MAVDVEGYGDHHRTTPHRLVLRRGLYQALIRAFDDAGLPWADCRHEDCGDGVLVLAPPQIPKSPFVEFLPSALAVALHRHNRRHRAEERIRLRMALHAGEIVYDDHGVTAPAINRAFRLLEAPPLRRALAKSSGVLAMITSEWFFDEVVRNSQGLDPATFRPVRVEVKETSTIGWLSLPDRPFPARAPVLRLDLPARAADYRMWHRLREHARVLTDRGDAC
jgi:hypothetical protein